MKTKLIKIMNDVFKKMYKSKVIPYKFTQNLNYMLLMRTPYSLKNPKNFNEKIQWLKANYKDEKMVIGADKYRVRKYLEEKGLSNYLNELYYVYDSPNDINFDSLPNKFALKTTHGCSTNLIVDDKSKIDYNYAVKQVQSWMKIYAGESSGEMHYQKITPRIIVEKYLDDGSGSLPLDYKIFCFNGEPKYIRITDEKNLATGASKQAWFDFDWNFMDFTKKEFKANPDLFQKPKSLKEMYHIAKVLSEDFPFVRVDLYEISGRAVFGELTFTPTGGFGKMFTDDTNKFFGDLLELPKFSQK